jgi:hypothetical protein
VFALLPGSSLSLQEQLCPSDPGMGRIGARRLLSPHPHSVPPLGLMARPSQDAHIPQPSQMLGGPRAQPAVTQSILTIMQILEPTGVSPGHEERPTAH